MWHFSSLFIFLAFTATSSSSVATESVEVLKGAGADNKNDTKNEYLDRMLRLQRKKVSRTFRRKITPMGQPELVIDSNGNVKRRRSVVDLRQLLLDDDEDDVDIQLLNDEASLTLKVRRDDSDEDPFESWYGSDEITGNHLTMVKTATIWGDTVTTGTMYGRNGTVYQIRTLSSGDVVAEEVKQASFDRELTGPHTDVDGDDDVDPETIDEIDGLPDGGRRGRRKLRRLDSSSQIDVMVLYTKGAMCAAAGFGSRGTCTASPTNLAKIEGIITLAVAETNKAYQLSGIPTKLRLVKTHFDATYNEYTTGWESTLGYIRNNGDGRLDYVHAMRDQYGADFVSMIVDIGSYCGIGYMPTSPTAGDAFSVVQWNCATGYYSFGHELAHNMGCNHDVNNAGGVTAGSNYGYQNPESRFRSIMAYDCATGCPRIQYFSNPNVNFNGLPTGSARANNAAVIKRNLAAHANYRQSVVKTIPKPVQSPRPTPVVSRPTAPPATSTNTKLLRTTLSGGFVGGAGNMFDIKARTNIYVTNFAMHATSASTVTIEVYKKKSTGTCVGSQFDSSKWQKIGQRTFQSSEAFSPTILPEGTFAPVYIAAGTVQSFYITFTEATNLNRYSQGSTVGSVQASNNDLQIIQGFAKGYLFGPDYSPRAWNGVVYYKKGSSASKPATLPTRAQIKRPLTKRDTVAQLTTTFSGGNGQAGNMFEILAIKDIIVKSFAIHTNSLEEVQVLVYFMKGSYLGFEHNPDAWTKIADTWVLGLGSSNPTPIPDSDVANVVINAGETYSFYITLTKDSMRYSSGIIPVADSAVEFIRSSGIRYPFSTSFPDRMWNGVLKYISAESTARNL